MLLLSTSRSSSAVRIAGAHILALAIIAVAIFPPRCHAQQFSINASGGIFKTENRTSPLASLGTALTLHNLFRLSVDGSRVWKYQTPPCLDSSPGPCPDQPDFRWYYDLTGEVQNPHGKLHAFAGAGIGWLHNCGVKFVQETQTVYSSQPVGCSSNTFVGGVRADATRHLQIEASARRRGDHRRYYTDVNYEYRVGLNYRLR